VPEIVKFMFEFAKVIQGKLYVTDCQRQSTEPRHKHVLRHF